MTDTHRLDRSGWSRQMSVGAASGSAAMFRVGAALGWVPAFAAAERPTLKPVAGKRTVVVLGAGISGLVAAHELSRASYRCTVLEASHRAGERNLTLRRGDKVDELGHSQVCPFDDDPDLYLNAVAMTVSLVGDPSQGGKMDFAGFMAAYTQFFGTKEQPNLPARSAVQVAALAAPGMLVEVEVQLARPPKK